MSACYPVKQTYLYMHTCQFAILVHTGLKRGHFISKEARKERLLQFIEHFNATLAKPFKWTSKPLTA